MENVLGAITRRAVSDEAIFSLSQPEIFARSSRLLRSFHAQAISADRNGFKSSGDYTAV
jgi:hypothetical protein